MSSYRVMIRVLVAAQVLPVYLVIGSGRAEAKAVVALQQAAEPVPPQALPPTTRQTNVTVEDRPQNFMATIAQSTLFGAVTGGLVGASLFIIDRPMRDAHHIGYWAAGGALVGAAVGVINVAVNQAHSERAISYLERTQGGKRALGVRLLRVSF